MKTVLMALESQKAKIQKEYEKAHKVYMRTDNENITSKMVNRRERLHYALRDLDHAIDNLKMSEEYK